MGSSLIRPGGCFLAVEELLPASFFRPRFLGAALLGVCVGVAAALFRFPSGIPGFAGGGGGGGVRSGDVSLYPSYSSYSSYSSSLGSSYACPTQFEVWEMAELPVLSPYRGSNGREVNVKSADEDLDSKGDEVNRLTADLLPGESPPTEVFVMGIPVCVRIRKGGTTMAPGILLGNGEDVSGGGGCI